MKIFSGIFLSRCLLLLADDLKTTLNSCVARKRKIFSLPRGKATKERQKEREMPTCKMINREKSINYADAPEQLICERTRAFVPCAFSSEKHQMEMRELFIKIQQFLY